MEVNRLGRLHLLRHRISDLAKLEEEGLLRPQRAEHRPRALSFAHTMCIPLQLVFAALKMSTCILYSCPQDEHLLCIRCSQDEYHCEHRFSLA